jgi:hypothetical protein
MISKFRGVADLSNLLQFVLLDAKGSVMSHTKRITYDAKDFGRGRAMSAAVQVVTAVCPYTDRKETHLVLIKGTSAPTAVTGRNRNSRPELKHA